MELPYNVKSLFTAMLDLKEEEPIPDKVVKAYWEYMVLLDKIQARFEFNHAPWIVLHSGYRPDVKRFMKKDNEHDVPKPAVKKPVNEPSELGKWMEVTPNSYVIINCKETDFRDKKAVYLGIGEDNETLRVRAADDSTPVLRLKFFEVKNPDVAVMEETK